MSNVLTFKPRPKPVTPETPEPLSGDKLRVQIEAGVQAALDLADHYIAVLNGMDGCPDLEDVGDDEPSLAAPKNTAGSQVTWLRGNDWDGEADAPQTALPEVATEAAPEMVAVAPFTPLAPNPDAVVVAVSPLRWGGRGNVIAAAGTALLDMLERA